MRSRYKPIIPSLIIRLFIFSVSVMAPPTLYPSLCNVMAHKPMTFACMSAIPLRRCSSPFRERRRRAASPLGLLRSPRRRPSISAPVGCTARAPHTRKPAGSMQTPAAGACSRRPSVVQRSANPRRNPRALAAHGNRAAPARAPPWTRRIGDKEPRAARLHPGANRS